ncbi:MAG: SPOR domain-containing protein [Bacteroidia bacterium]
MTFSLAFSQEVSIINDLPTSGSAGQAIEAKFSLTKSANMGSFAKFQLDLPAGFDAQSMEIKGGNFTFENNRIKIVWVSLPPDASFDFIFKITPSANVSGNVSITPQFFYLENNVKKEYNVPSVTINFGGSSTVASDNTNNSSNNTTTSDNSNTNTNSNNNTSNADNTSNTNNTNSNNNTNNTSSSNISNTNNTNTNNNNSNTGITNANNNNNTSTNNNSSTTSNTVKRNVAYHVQLAALTNKPSKSKFAHYGAVKIVEDAGLYKVLVGKFTTLAEARAYKKTLISKGAEGCFIVAYENGVRVKIN